jgi:hypothetical protein
LLIRGGATLEISLHPRLVASDVSISNWPGAGSLRWRRQSRLPCSSTFCRYCRDAGERAHSGGRRPMAAEL